MSTGSLGIWGLSSVARKWGAGRGTCAKFTVFGEVFLLLRNMVLWGGTVDGK